MSEIKIFFLELFFVSCGRIGFFDFGEVFFSGVMSSSSFLFLTDCDGWIGLSGFLPFFNFLVGDGCVGEICELSVFSEGDLADFGGRSSTLCIFWMLCRSIKEVDCDDD